MLAKYQDDRHLVRDTVLKVVQSLATINEQGTLALEKMDIGKLDECRKTLKNIQKDTEKIDNDIVIIFAKYTPEARDLRELVSYLKVTSSLNRIHANQKSYLKNMQSMLLGEHEHIIELVKESLHINRCTLNAFHATTQMFQTFDDNEKILNLATKIEVEYAKTEDIYSLIEKEIIQKMCISDGHSEEYFNLLKYIRKNLKIIDRLDSIAQRVIFARIGGKL
jgi:phosphate transport system protein